MMVMGGGRMEGDEVDVRAWVEKGGGRALGVFRRSGKNDDGKCAQVP